MDASGAADGLAVNSLVDRQSRLTPITQRLSIEDPDLDKYRILAKNRLAHRYGRFSIAP